MTKKQLINATILNGSIVLINILLLSEGFLDLLSRDSILLKAIGISVILMSILLFGYGNYSIYKPQAAKLYKSTDLLEDEDYVEALRSCPNQKQFRNEIEKGIRQIERRHKKSELLKVILLQYFTEGEMTYNRFRDVIAGTEAVFWSNIKKMINRIAIFDAEIYAEAPQENSANPASPAYYQEDIRGILTQNDVLLKKIDDLILEVSKLDEVREVSLNELPAIQEIDRLIEETRYYQA